MKVNTKKKVAISSWALLLLYTGINFFVTIPHGQRVSMAVGFLIFSIISIAYAKFGQNAFCWERFHSCSMVLIAIFFVYAVFSNVL